MSRRRPYAFRRRRLFGQSLTTSMWHSMIVTDSLPRGSRLRPLMHTMWTLEEFDDTPSCVHAHTPTGRQHGSMFALLRNVHTSQSAGLCCRPSPCRAAVLHQEEAPPLLTAVHSRKPLSQIFSPRSKQRKDPVTSLGIFWLHRHLS